MGISEDMTDLADELQKGALNVRTELQEFPSGAVWLDVYYSGRLFNVAYQPTGRYFGVDEYIPERDGISTDFHFIFQDFESAKAKLLDLLEEAGATPAHAQKSRALT
jgi:hypothetical protein